MGLTLESYDEKELIDYCWYKSSTILFSKCYDNKNAYKDLEVTFLDGRTYKYYDVIIQDYLLFKNGGLANSQGKALNSFIKKYKFEKLDKLDVKLISDLREEKEKKEKEKNEIEKKDKEFYEKNDFVFESSKINKEDTVKVTFNFNTVTNGYISEVEYIEIIGEKLKQGFINYIKKR